MLGSGDLLAIFRRLVTILAMDPATTLLALAMYAAHESPGPIEEQHRLVCRWLGAFDIDATLLEIENVVDKVPDAGSTLADLAEFSALDISAKTKGRLMAQYDWVPEYCLCQPRCLYIDPEDPSTWVGGPNSPY